MRTEKQLEASRLNGTNRHSGIKARPYPHDSGGSDSRHGQGPVTPEGKWRSSQNSRHGLIARTYSLQVEDQSQFREILRELTDEHLPATHSERRLVETMALAEWKLIRFLSSEKVAIDLQVQVEIQSIPDYDHDGAAVIAEAITHMTEERRTLREINLNSARLNREQDRALNMLLKLQDRRARKPVPDSGPHPDAPHPINTPPSPQASADPRDEPSQAFTEPPLPEFPDHAAADSIECPVDKKINAGTHHSLKTKVFPQVRYPSKPDAVLLKHAVPGAIPPLSTPPAARRTAAAGVSPFWLASEPPDTPSAEGFFP